MTLNDAFIEKLDTSHSTARGITQTFIIERALSLYPKAGNIRVDLDKTANVVKLSIALTLDGKELSGEKEWSELELAASDKPVTTLFEEVLVSVVAQEAAPVS